MSFREIQKIQKGRKYKGVSAQRVTQYCTRTNSSPVRSAIILFKYQQVKISRLIFIRFFAQAFQQAHVLGGILIDKFAVYPQEHFCGVSELFCC